MFFRLPANQDLRGGGQNRDLRPNGKQMCIAAPAQKLLRIVFRSYMCFPGSEIQKKCFDGDRCVSRSDEIVIYTETKKMSIAAIKRKLLRIFF